MADNVREIRWDDPDQTHIRVSFELRGEEAIEFIRWAKKRGGRPNKAARILLLHGMKERGILPSWWSIK